MIRLKFGKSLSLVLFIVVAWVLPASLAAETASYEEQMREWRQARHDRLADANGWMTLVGLEWLQAGENSVGNSETSSAQVPGGPESWGTILLENDEIRFVPATGSDITVDGATVEETILVSDNQGQPTVVRSGDLSFYVIFRESYALRIKDRKAPALLAFKSMPAYEIQPDWRIEGRLVRAPEGETILISNILGHTSPTPVFGNFEFERDGESFSLIALGDNESSSLWFLFADKTTGRETYGAGRFLYSDGMPENGRLVVDFNKAYNPPCAYNDYSTCSLPPQQNRLRIPIRAGEKKYHN